MFPNRSSHNRVFWRKLAGPCALLLLILFAVVTDKYWKAAEIRAEAFSYFD